MPVLVLNSSLQPLSVIPERRLVVLLSKQKVTFVDDSVRELIEESRAFGPVALIWNDLSLCSCSPMSAFRAWCCSPLASISCCATMKCASTVASIAVI